MHSKVIISAKKGFTLIEVMVALLVLALAMTALQLRISQQLSNGAYLQDKLIASWVAKNQMELLLLENRLSNSTDIPVQSGTEEMAGKLWQWQIEDVENFTAATEEQSIRPIIVSVANEGQTETPVYSLQGVVDANHNLQ